MIERHIRHSKQRDIIYNYLLNTSSHPTADMIYRELKEVYPDFSIATIYRNLKLLESLNKIRKVNINDGLDHFDAICYSHPHFVCKVCKRIFDLEPINVSTIKKVEPDVSNYKIEDIDIVYSGICPECMKKEK